MKRVSKLLVAGIFALLLALTGSVFITTFSANAEVGLTGYAAACDSDCGHDHDEYSRDGYTVEDIRQMIEGQSFTNASIQSAYNCTCAGAICGQSADRIIMRESKNKEYSIEVVLFGDGFMKNETVDEIGSWPSPKSNTFLSYANGAMLKMLSTHPFNLFSEYFTFYADLTISHSNIISDNKQNVSLFFKSYIPETNKIRSTVLENSRACVETLAKRQVWVNTYDNSGNLLKSVDATVSNHVMIQVIANTKEDGGIAYFPVSESNITQQVTGVALTTVKGSGTTNEWYNTFLHEFGHSFGYLADEYVSNDVNVREAPNMTCKPSIRWSHWVGYGDYGDYSRTNIGIIRNTYKNEEIWAVPCGKYCKMGDSAKAFCAVCAAELTRRMAELTGEPFAKRSQESSTVTISSNRILPYAFNGNIYLQNLIISAGVSIGDYAFIGATGLKTIRFMGKTPPSFNSIAFEGLNKANIKVIVPMGTLATYKNYGWGVFNIVEEFNVAEISSNADSTNVKITKVNFPILGTWEIPSDYIGNENKKFIVTGIGDDALKDQPLCIKVKISAGVTDIGKLTFYNCPTLTDIEVNSNNSNFTASDGVLFNKTGTLLNYPRGKTSTTYTIPATVISIGENAFRDSNNKLTGITISANVKDIGKNAFSGSTGLIKIIFSASSLLKTIGDNAFLGCISLETFAFNQCGALETIGNYAFQNCNKLTTSDFTNCTSLRTIGNYAFQNCNKLTTSDFKNCGLLESIGIYAFSDCHILETVSFKVDEKLKTTIGSYAFYNCWMLKEIEIPNSVTSIGSYAFSGPYSGLTMITFKKGSLLESIVDNAFSGCGRLTTVNFEEGILLKTIGNYAFSDCISLTIVDFGGNSLLENIGNNAFFGCISLETLNFYQLGSLKTIGNYAFSGCNKLLIVVFEQCATLKSIGNNAFSGCTSLETVNIIKCGSLESISNYTFYGCTSLKTIAFNECTSLKTIGDYAFYNCKLIKDNNLVGIEIPNSVVTIGNYSFSACKFTGIKIPNSVVSIGNNAFSGAALKTVDFEKVSKLEKIGNNAFLGSSLTSITIPISVKSIGNFAFSSCHALTGINVETDNSYYSSENGVLFNYDKSLLIRFPAAKATEEYIIPKSVTKIQDEAFSYCIRLTKINFESSLANIGSYAFYNCKNLNVVMLENAKQLTTIGNYAFYGSNIASLIIPANVSSIGYSAFLDSKNLNKVTFEEGNRFAVIGSYAFYGCNIDSLTLSTNVSVIGDYAFYACNIDSLYIPANVSSIGDSVFKDCNDLKTVVFADGNQAAIIGTYAFYGCNIDSLTLSTNVSVIGDYAFYACNIDSLYIPANVSSIGDSVFKDCNDLKTVVFADGNQAAIIGTYAFYGCNIDSLTLSTNVSVIGDYAFYACNIDSLYIPANVSSIGNFTFFNSKNLNKMTFEEGNHTAIIGESAFAYCESLKTVRFEENCLLEFINSYAFYNCISLEEINIPANVQSIFLYAFANCFNLKTLTFEENSKLEYILHTTFEGCVSLSEITIPASVNTVAMYAFMNCIGLKKVTFESGSNVKNIKAYTFAYCKSLEEVNLHDGLVSINALAFFECISLKSINIPSSVQQVDLMRFVCTGITDNIRLTDITFNAVNDTVTPIEVKLTFDKSINLKKEDIKVCRAQIAGLSGMGTSYTLTISNIELNNAKTVTISILAPEGIALVGDTKDIVLYTDKASLTEISVNGRDGIVTTTELKLEFDKEPIDLSIDNITIIGATKGSLSGFGTTYTLTISDVTVKNGETISVAITAPAGALFKSSIKNAMVYVITYTDGLNFSLINNGTAYEVSVGSGLSGSNTIIVIPPAYNGRPVTKIASVGFYNCITLENIHIPSSVTVIGDFAFLSCTKLKNIALSTGLLSIGESAFYGCVTLEEIYIPSSVTAIGESAFAGCTKLKNISLPTGLLSIGESAFYGCITLEEIYIPSSVTAIGESAFYNCNKLISIIIPGSVATIGGYAFSDCTALRYVEIMSGVISIGSYAFSNCIGLERIEIPYSTINIGSYAFYGCINLIINAERGNPASGWAANWNYSNCIVVWACKMPQYTVTLDWQDGNNNSNFVTIAYGLYMPSADAPFYSGHFFEGYFTKPNGGGVMYYDADMTSIRTYDFNDDITLYAKWTDYSDMIWNGDVETGFAGGNGTESAPYQIGNGGQLAYLAYLVNNGNAYSGKYFILNNDIYLNDVAIWKNWAINAPVNSWTAIGTAENPFSGFFDGNGFAVYGIYINTLTDYQGLFGFIQDGNISSLGIERSYIKGSSFVGGIAGYCYGEISNCYNTGMVSSSAYYIDAYSVDGAYIGGIVGCCDGNINDCFNEGIISGNVYIGGIAGMCNGDINNCYNKGLICSEYYTDEDCDAGSYIGGIAGFISGNINYCYNEGKVISNYFYLDGYYTEGYYIGDYYIEGYYVEGHYVGGSYIGGIAGFNNGFIFACYNLGYISGNIYVGGITGWTCNFIISSYNAGKIVGYEDVGGIAGRTIDNGIIYCYNIGAISGNNSIGGIAGRIWDRGLINNNYNTGNISGGKYVGGIAGWTDGQIAITNSYNTGEISGDDYIGGIVGYFTSSHNIITFMANCYNQGNIFGSTYFSCIGGLVGVIGKFTAMFNNYNSGGLMGAYLYDNVGGIAGYVEGENNFGESNYYIDTYYTYYEAFGRFRWFNPSGINQHFYNVVYGINPSDSNNISKNFNLFINNVLPYYASSFGISQIFYYPVNYNYWYIGDKDLPVFDIFNYYIN